MCLSFSFIHIDVAEQPTNCMSGTKLQFDDNGEREKTNKNKNDESFKWMIQ